MDIEVVTIGTELLLGYTLDSNGAEIARALGEHGIRVVRRTSVGDRAEAIRDAVADGLRRTGAVLTTGGLGPTRDDISKRAVADLLGAPLVFNEAVWEALVARFAKLGRVPVASNRVQADVPLGAMVLPNPWGTAPGLWLEAPGLHPSGGSGGLVIMLPGVPREMRNLLQHEVVPRLIARGSETVVRSLTVRTSGIPESTLAERLGEIETAIAPLTLAYLPGEEGVDLRLTAWGLPPGEAATRLRTAADLLRERGGEHVYGEGDVDLAGLVLEAARSRGVRIGAAESCTGGLLGKRLTDVPGSSDVFKGAIVAYDNTLKTSLLDVPAELLVRHGAVSEEVARAMANGALARLGVDLALAVTGIAGPGGGSAEKPVGTIWLAMASDGAVAAKHIVLPGSRAEIRARAAQAGLFLMLRRLQGSKP
jgi:competence/damage-inducible protein CinA-like protein